MEKCGGLTVPAYLERTTPPYSPDVLKHHLPGWQAVDSTKYYLLVVEAVWGIKIR